jgi:hypothetical protein
MVSHDPGRDLVPVTPDDETDLPRHRGLVILTEGTLVLMNRGGVTVTFGTLPAGAHINSRAKRVLETTGATVALIK